MKKGVKIALIIGGAAVVGVSTYLVIRKLRKKKKEEAEKKRIADENKEAIESTVAALEMQQGSKPTPPSSKGGCRGKLITPVRNLNKDINNKFSEIKGRTLFPAIKSTDAEKGHNFASGFTTVRTYPAVNTAGNHWSGLDASNEVGVIMAGRPIGEIIKEQYDNHDPAHRWFKVKLNRSMEDCSGYVPSWLGGCDDVTTGWVRADTVTFKSSNETPRDCQIEKLCRGGSSKTDGAISIFTELGFKALAPSSKVRTCEAVGVSNYSAADGQFIQRYKTSYPLGAEVFPHSNWMLPKGQAFECEEGLTDM